MFSEDDYIMISALSHYVFCPRRCALIHVEGIWAENTFTARGKVLHERVDTGEDESRGDVRITRGLNIYSRRLGLSGKADVVEFHEVNGVDIPYPVEYKSGQPKQDICDLAQVCAQALCLEEMTLSPVRQAAIYYGRPRRRLAVDLDDALRRETERVIAAVHEMVKSRIVPPARKEKKCAACSLYDQCMPGLGGRKIDTYIKELYEDHEKAP